MKRVIISLLFLFSLTMLLCTSCDNNKSSSQNVKKADIKQDTTMLDVAAESPEDDGIGDEENWSDEEYWNDDDYRDPEAKKNDGLYTNLLPGKWFCDLGTESETESDQGIRTTATMHVTESLALSDDFTYTQRLFNRNEIKRVVEQKYKDGGLIRTNVIHYGANIDITGESTGTWYVDNSNLVLNASSWKITPNYLYHHGKAPSDYRNLEDNLIREYASFTKEMMDGMKSVYSVTSSRRIVNLNGNEMLIYSNGETKTFKKQNNQ